MVPTWNPNLKYLREALVSVLAAGIAADEMQIAIVDDASESFDAAAFLREQALDRVECYPGVARLGIAGSWNRCIEMARGEWIHILHQDDRVRPDFYGALRRGIAIAPLV